MKKLLLTALGVAALSTVASAAPSCLTTNNNAWTIASLGAAGCQVGDKLFSNFTDQTGSVAANGATLSFGGPDGVIAGPNPAVYSMNFNLPNNVYITSNVAFTYSISIIPAQVAAGWTTAITKVTGGFQDNGTDTATLTKVLSTGCTVTVVDVAAQITTNACTGSAQTINIQESFVQTANGQANGQFLIPGFGNSFTETFTAVTVGGTPEPVSMLLFGSGLLALATLGRKKLVKK